MIKKPIQDFSILPDKAIEEYIELVKKDFKITLTMEEARPQAQNFFDLMKTLAEDQR